MKTYQQYIKISITRNPLIIKRYGMPSTAHVPIEKELMRSPKRAIIKQGVRVA